MTKPDFKQMSRGELKTYLMNHRSDQQAWSAFFEKLNHLDRNQGYAADLSIQEMEDLIRRKLQGES